MLKHSKITADRIEQFIKFELLEHLIGTRHSLEIEYCPKAHATDIEARAQGPWQKIESGFEYGPAYREVWFRITGKVPKEWAGKSIGLLPDLGSERTLWRKGTPLIGVDGKHEIVRLYDEARGGESIDVCIQAYTGNPECRVHRRELPREKLVERVEGAWLVELDDDLKALAWDCEFCFDLLKSLDETDPSTSLLLRSLNDVCNTYDSENRATIAKCRRILREALGDLGGEVRHSITAVGHAHLDTAWLWPVRITKLKMAHTTANQLHLIDRYPEYVFVHSQASQYEWLEKQYPTLFRRVKEATAKGQWEPLGSMWVEADCNLSGGEALVRQFLYGKRYFKKHFGIDTVDMWLPDVFGYSAALPQILRKFGIEYFLTQKISWNQFNKFPHNTFWWRGIDGTRVWTHFPPADTYVGDCTPKQILESVKKHRDHGRSDQSLYVFGWGDGGGGPTERHLEFLRRARSAQNLPVIESKQRATEFFRQAYENSRDLMTWSGELYFELHRGTYTSQAANKKSNRECEHLLRDAEWLACFSPTFPARYPADELEAAWKLVLLNQFHDILPGSSVREVYEDSAQDYAEVVKVGERIIRDSLVQIASQLDTSSLQKPFALFTTALVSSQAEVPWSAAKVPQSIACIGDMLPVQCVEEFGVRKLIFETPSAALGSVAVADFSDIEAPNTKFVRARERKLENEDWAVRFDSNGNITSIQSQDDSRLEFVEQGKLANLFQIFEDKPLFWSAWDIDIFALETGKNLVKSESFEIVERGPVRVAAEVVKRFGSSVIRQRISLGPTPGIRFDTEIDWHEEDKLLKVAFPVNVHSQRATYEIQYGNVERPTHVNTSWDVARFEVCAQRWFDLSEGGHGVALINDGKYGCDVRENVMRLSLLRAPKAPDPMCDMGVHRFTYVLLPHFDGYHQADVVACAYAVNSPVRIAPLKPQRGANLELPPLVATNSRNLVIESVKRAEDSNRIVVRLYDSHNTRGMAELFCAKGIRRAWLADLNENPLEAVELNDGMVIFEYKPFEIITILIEP